MKTIAKFLTQLNNDRRAATAIEYGLIAALIAAVIVGVVTTIGTDLQAEFTTIEGSLN